MNVTGNDSILEDIMENATCSDPLTRIAAIHVYLEKYRNPLLQDGQHLYAFTVVYGIILLFGIMGNFLTIFVIVKTVNLHSHTNYFLCNMAVSDIILLVVGIPTDLYYLWIPYHAPGGRWVCNIKAVLLATATNVSILTITGLTLERFIAICYPLHLRSYFDRRRLSKFMYAVWGLAILPAIVLNIQFTVRHETEPFCGQEIKETSICDFTLVFPHLFEIYLIFLFFLPMILITYWYSRILHTLRNISISSNQNSPVSLTARTSETEVSLYVRPKPARRRPRSQQAQTMVIKMLIVVTAVFFLCYLPFHVQRLITHHTDCEKHNCDYLHMFFVLAGVLHYVSATVNPIVYNMMSIRFRTAFIYWILSCTEERPSYTRYVKN